MGCMSSRECIPVLPTVIQKATATLSGIVGFMLGFIECFRKSLTNQTQSETDPNQWYQLKKNPQVHKMCIIILSQSSAQNHHFLECILELNSKYINVWQKVCGYLTVFLSLYYTHSPLFAVRTVFLERLSTRF